MATNNKINKKVAHELNQKVAVGFRKHCAKSGSVFFNNKKWSAKEVDSDLQRRSGGEDAVQAARLALHAAVLERDKIEDQTAEVFDGIRRPLRAMAERAWNGGSRLMHTEFCDIEARIGVMNDATGFSR